ncbi:MAG: glycosyltransferase [Chloroflexaceae bacterium]|nr:glycosyltransferase [Chloroflexaceae bacterium]
MSIFFWGTVFLGGIILVIPAIHHLRLRFARCDPPTTQFAVAVIVPCKGNNDPDFENNLLCIVQQAYDGPVTFRLCAESDQDPAVPTMRKLEQRFENVQVCIAGLSTRSSQKTYNVLKGMECVTDTDIFVIADADIQPHSTWLQELVAPFRHPKVGATTGFFRRIPLSSDFHWGNYLAGLFGTFIISGISDDTLKGLWGGSLAVRKSVMDTYQLYERFATEIVDDIAIMHALHQHHIARRYVQSCTLKSYCHMSVSESIEWLVRQIQFSQIYLKLPYALYVLVGIPYVAYIFLAPVLVLYGLLAHDLLALLSGAGFGLSVVLTGTLLYFSAPVNPASVSPGDARYRLLPWLLATPVAFICVALALFKTFARVKKGVLSMHWRNITYLVDVKTGKVKKVIR